MTTDIGPGATPTTFFRRRNLLLWGLPLLAVDVVYLAAAFRDHGLLAYAGFVHLVGLALVVLWNGQRRALVAAFDRAHERQALEAFQFVHSPMALIEWGPEMRIRRWSKQAESMFGWTEAEVVGRTLREAGFLEDGEADDHERVKREFFEGRRDTSESLRRCRHKDGSVSWSRWFSRAMRGPDGALQYFFSAGIDVSELLEANELLQEKEGRLRAIFDQASAGIALLDEQGRWLSVNQRICEITGYSSDELLRMDFQTITHPEDVHADLELAREVSRGERTSYALEKRYLHKDGRVVWIRLHVGRIDATAITPLRFVSVIEDITQRRESERELRELHAELERKVAERTRQLQDTTRRWADRNRELNVLAEMMSALPAARDAHEANAIVACFLPRLFRSQGGEVWIEQDEAGRFERIAGWNLPAHGPSSIAVDDCWALRRGQALQVEDPCDPQLCRHGHEVAGRQEPHACIPIVALGDLIGLIHLRWTEGEEDAGPPDRALLASTSEQIGLAVGNVRLREELRRQALRDPLTGLFNRRYFEEILGQRMAEHRRTGRGFGILMIDIDHFKRINDRHGHDAGDEALRAVAASLRALRSDEAVFRLGGEEFVMLAGDSGGGEMASLAERVRAALEGLAVTFGGTPLPAITASIGAAHFPTHARDGSALLACADHAMYEAKQGGRNRVCFAA